MSFTSATAMLYHPLNPRLVSSKFLPQQPLAGHGGPTKPIRAMATSRHIKIHAEHQKRVAEFYDELSGLWESVWSEHMHHGFYDPDSSVSDLSGHRAAQIRMIEETLRFAGVSGENRPTSIVDVGCGMGGSSRYLASKFGANCEGITLSPVQARRAQALAAAQGLSDKVCFQVADALKQPFPDGKFDLVWSMESAEYMPDKSEFIGELVRVAAPGATIIIATNTHRDLGPSEESLQPWENNLLNKISDAFRLSPWFSAADYVQLLQSHNLQDIKTADWSQNIGPYWPAFIQSTLSWECFTFLLRNGWKTVRVTLAVPSVIEALKKDVMRFSIITCRKPHE